MKLLSSPTKPPASLPLSSRPSTISERRLARVGRAHFGEDLQAGATQLVDVDGARRQRLEVEDQPAKTPRYERQQSVGPIRFERIELQAERSARMCGEKFELAEDNSEVVLELAIDDADAAGARAGDGQGSAAQAGRGEDELDEISHSLLLRGGARENEGSASDEMPTPTNPSHDSPRLPPHARAGCKPLSSKALRRTILRRQVERRLPVL